MKKELSVEQVTNLVSTLSNINLGDADAYKNIHEIVLTLISAIPLSAIVVPKGSHFFRCRINSEKYFNTIQELSYNPVQDNIKDFGRANTPGQSIFYASMGIHTALHETIYNYSPYDESKIITVGVWTSNRNLALFDINSFDEQIQLGKDNNVPLYSNLSYSEKKICEIVLNLFSKHFTEEVQKDPNNYKISCAIANSLYPKTGGISFGSVKKKYLNIVRHYPHEEDQNSLNLKDYRWSNVALTSYWVDKSLIFKDAIRYTFLKTSPFDLLELDTKHPFHIENDKIYWG